MHRARRVIRTAVRDEFNRVMAADVPQRKSWKQDLAPYLEIDPRRSLGQIASVVLPYLGVWVLACDRAAGRRARRWASAWSRPCS